MTIQHATLNCNAIIGGRCQRLGKKHFARTRGHATLEHTSDTVLEHTIRHHEAMESQCPVAVLRQGRIIVPCGRQIVNAMGAAGAEAARKRKEQKERAEAERQRMLADKDGRRHHAQEQAHGNPSRKTPILTKPVRASCHPSRFRDLICICTPERTLNI